jgi:hypothetical protein
MRFERTARFDSDFESLPAKHQQQFRALVSDFHQACVTHVETGGRSPWPKRLRIRRLTGAPPIWEVTWSFASPDGRATFEFVNRDGEVRVLWRRIVDHGVFRRP